MEGAFAVRILEGGMDKVLTNANVKVCFNLPGI